MLRFGETKAKEKFYAAKKKKKILGMLILII